MNLSRLLALSLITSSALAQEGVVLFDRGDDVAGIGPFDDVPPYGNTVDVNDQGQWAGALHLDLPPATNSVLVLDGTIVLQEGHVLPSGARILYDAGSWSPFQGVALTDAGRLFYSAVLDDDLGKKALMLDTSVLLEPGDPLPSPDVPAGSTIRSVLSSAANDSGQLAAHVVFTPPQGVDLRGLALIDVDANGQITQIAVPYQTGAPAPGIGLPLDFVSALADLNDAGQLAWSGAVDSGSSSDDDVAYLGSTLLFREGEPSPLPGEAWLEVGWPSVNASGSWSCGGGVGPSTAKFRPVIVKDGVIVRAVGDVIPATAPYALDDLHEEPQTLTDSGEIYWWGKWSPADPRKNSAQFVGDDPLLIRWETQVEGLLYDGRPAKFSPYSAISDNGRYVITEARLQGRETVVLFDRQGTPQDPCAVADDALEDNDDASAAVDVPAGWHNHLVVTRTDEDWYRITVGDNKVLEVVASHSFEAGDLDLEIYADDGTTLLASSTKAEDDEWATVANTSGGPLPVRIRVFLSPTAGPDCARYRLGLDRHSPNGCVGFGGVVDDAFEPNDDGASAAALSLGWTTDLTAHPYDKDFYRFPVPAGATATLVFEPADAGDSDEKFGYLLRAQSGGPVVAGDIEWDGWQGYVQWTNTTGAAVTAELEVYVDDITVVRCLPYDVLLAVDGDVGAAYCDPRENGSGLPARLYGTGSDFASDNQLTLVADRMPVNQFGYLLTSETQQYVVPPGADGYLCLGGAIGRLVKQVKSTGAGGEFAVQPDLTQLPPPTKGVVVPGDTWSFQAWFRDGTKSNFTNGVVVEFQ